MDQDPNHSWTPGMLAISEVGFWPGPAGFQLTRREPSSQSRHQNRADSKMKLFTEAYRLNQPGKITQSTALYEDFLWCARPLWHYGTHGSHLMLDAPSGLEGHRNLYLLTAAVSFVALVEVLCFGKCGSRLPRPPPTCLPRSFSWSLFRFLKLGGCPAGVKRRFRSSPLQSWVPKAIGLLNEKKKQGGENNQKLGGYRNSNNSGGGDGGGGGGGGGWWVVVVAAAAATMTIITPRCRRRRSRRMGRRSRRGRSSRRRIRRKKKKENKKKDVLRGRHHHDHHHRDRTGPAIIIITTKVGTSGNVEARATQGRRGTVPWMIWKRTGREDQSFLPVLHQFIAGPLH